MKQITDVFFDLDHTLWDFDRNSGLAFQRVFQKHKIPLVLEDFLKIYEPINFNYWKAYREERVTKQALRRGRLIDSFVAFNLSFPTDIIDAIAVSYIDELPGNNHLLDGAVDILNYLQPRYNMHIITNGFTEVQGIKLRTSGIDKFFKSVTTSEDVGVKKPNRLVFERAMHHANTSPVASVMIGDKFEADILGAKAVGMTPIFYNYRNEKVPSQHLSVNHLLELKKYL